MRRVFVILLTMVLLISIFAVPTYAKELGNYTVDLYYWNADKTIKTAFVGTTVYLDASLDPFHGQIRVFLPEEIEPGDYFDIELLFTATEGNYTIDKIELSTSGYTYFDVFTYSYAEMDSGHVSIQGLCVDEKFAGMGTVGIVTINYSVMDPEYEVTHSVIDGTPTKRFIYLMSVTEVNLSGLGELGFFARILEGILNLPNLLVQGIKNLFLPSQADAIDFRDKIDALLADRLGAAYQANDIIEDFAYSFGSGTSSTLEENSDPATITLPALTVNLAGADFTFGGWDVQIIPDGFEPIVSTLKTVVNMVCTLAFLNALKSRLEGFFH